MENDVMSLLEKQLPRSFYQVFLCETTPFDYDPELPLFQSNDLGRCHSFAYDEWQNRPADFNQMYTIIQVFDGSCRGGYGFPEDKEE